MKWNVFYYDINRKKISTYNIFDHSSFLKYVKEAMKECKFKQEFAEQLKSELRYYFWAKAEWELLFYPWVGDEKAAIKIDVYDQVMNNFEIFVDYVWSFKGE